MNIPSTFEINIFINHYLFHPVNHFWSFRKTGFVDIVSFRFFRGLGAGVTRVTSGRHTDGDPTVWATLNTALTFNLVQRYYKFKYMSFINICFPIKS